MPRADSSMDRLKFAPPCSVPSLRLKVCGGMPRSAVAIIQPKRAFDEIGPLSVRLDVAPRHPHNVSFDGKAVFGQVRVQLISIG